MKRNGGGNWRHSSDEAGHGNPGQRGFKKYLAKPHGVHRAVGQRVCVWGGSHLPMGFLAPQVISLAPIPSATQLYDLNFQEMDPLQQPCPWGPSASGPILPGAGTPQSCGHQQELFPCPFSQPFSAGGERPCVGNHKGTTVTADTHSTAPTGSGGDQDPGGAEHPRVPHQLPSGAAWPGLSPPMQRGMEI